MLGKVTMSLSALLLNAVLTRILSPEAIGAYFIAVSITSVMGIISLFGLNQITVRLIAESLATGKPGRARQSIFIIFIIVLGTSIVGGLFYLLGGGMWITQKIFNSPLLGDLIFMLAVWTALSTFLVVLSEVFRGFNNIRLSAAFEGSGAVSRILLIALLVFFSWYLHRPGTVSHVILLTLVSNFIVLIFAVLSLFKLLKPLSGLETEVTIKDVVLMAWPLWITSLGNLIINHADIWILGIFQPATDIALYGTILRLSVFVSVPLIIVNSVTSPMIAELYSKKLVVELEQTLRTIATLASIPAIIIFLIFVIFGRPILFFLFGLYYETGYFALMILGFGALVNVYSGSCGLTLIMSGHQLSLMKISVATGLLSLMLLFYLSREYGFNGTSAAIAISTILQNVLAVYFARRKTGVWTHADPLLLLNLKSIWSAIGE